MTIKRIYIVILLLAPFIFIGQTIPSKSDSTRKADRKNRLEEYKNEYNLVVADSFHIEGNLVDLEFGLSCGEPNSGIFLFNKLIADRKDFKDSLVFILIPCATRYRDVLVKGNRYKMTVTPNKMKSWRGVQWTKYPDNHAKKLFSTDGKNSILKVRD